jgi:hypothetical protein
VTEAGLSGTYVIGESLELHGEVASRRDRRLPLALPRDFRFEQPVEFTTPLPVWSTSPKAQLVQLLVGGQYTFDDRTPIEGWNVVLEYFYQNEGWTDSQWDSYFGQLRRLKELIALSAAGGPFQPQLQPVAGGFGAANFELLRARPAFWGRHYGFLRISRVDLFFDGFEVAAYGIPSLQDFSVLAGANVAYESQSGLQFRLDFRLFGGSSDSEFGRLPNRALTQVELGYSF